MSEKYLLYIDILGFSELVRTGDAKIAELYDHIDRLNSHRHSDFRTIVFSDTILIYNHVDPRQERDHRYLVMYLIEFVQNLIISLLPLKIYFRAQLRYGKFQHQKLKHLESYYGETLIKSHRADSSFPVIGLLMEKEIQPHNAYFLTADYSKDMLYVFALPYLNHLYRDTHGNLPAQTITATQTDTYCDIVEELAYLRDLFFNAKNEQVPQVRVKYEATRNLYLQNFGKMMVEFEASDFDARLICPDSKWHDFVAKREAGLAP